MEQKVTGTEGTGTERYWKTERRYNWDQPNRSNPSSSFRSESTSLPGLAEGESSGAQGLSGTPGSTNTNPIGDATKDTANVNGKTTTLATTGGVEDKVKAAEDAKAIVTNLEATLKQVQNIEANTNDQNVKNALQGQIAQLQGSLTTAKLDAANKDAAAKSTTTTPGTTTTGGTEDKVKAAEAAKGVVTQLEAKLNELKDKQAKAAPEAKGQLQSEIDKLQASLDTAKKDAANKDAAAKSTTTTPGSDGTKITPNGGDGTPVKTNLPSKTGGPPQQSKKVFNDNNDRKIKFVDRTKVIYRDNDDTNIDKQYIISSNKNTCPTQSETVALNGQIKPKGIRILADFDPCKISDGSVTLNMPNTGSIKLALLFIDNVGNNDAGVLVKPLKIQDLSTNQALFSVELDGNMNGINPLSGQSTSISRINGLAVYNDGDQPIQFNSGNMAALTATFTK